MAIAWNALLTVGSRVVGGGFVEEDKSKCS